MKWIAAFAFGLLQASTALANPTANELAQAAGQRLAPDGQVVNLCDTLVTPEVHEVPLGGALGSAWLLLIPGGDAAPACYGDTPGDIYLMATEGDGFRVIFSGGAGVIVLPSAHDGVADISVAGPGFTFPVLTWNGRDYANSGALSDAELQALGDLPIYP